jgi:hypothetical protein
MKDILRWQRDSWVFRMGLVALLMGVTSFAGVKTARGQLCATSERLSLLLGQPVKKSGDLTYYHKSPYFFIAHQFHGICDQISIFFDQEQQGIPLPITDQQLSFMLSEYGGESEWKPVNRLSINQVWNSKTGRSFAIYDTMRNKLVMMTRDSYRRERETSF